MTRLAPRFRGGADAIICYWVIDSKKAKGFDEKVGSFLREWIEKVWPVKNPFYPGREMTWDEWEVFKEKNPKESE